jgi:hypothetical protein
MTDRQSTPEVRSGRSSIVITLDRIFRWEKILRIMPTRESRLVAVFQADGYASCTGSIAPHCSTYYARPPRPPYDACTRATVSLHASADSQEPLQLCQTAMRTDQGKAKADVSCKPLLHLY